MTYTPTESELIEMGFKKYNDAFILEKTYFQVEVFPYGVYVSHPQIGRKEWSSIPFYPQSQEDIETLIRLLSYK